MEEPSYWVQMDTTCIIQHTLWMKTL
nr:unnamed protein product [Callosobruchus analis]